jgi:hypothetical protein
MSSVEERKALIRVVDALAAGAPLPSSPSPLAVVARDAGPGGGRGKLLRAARAVRRGAAVLVERPYQLGRGTGADAADSALLRGGIPPICRFDVCLSLLRLLLFFWGGGVQVVVLLAVRMACQRCVMRGCVCDVGSCGSRGASCALLPVRRPKESSRDFVIILCIFIIARAARSRSALSSLRWFGDGDWFGFL